MTGSIDLKVGDKTLAIIVTLREATHRINKQDKICPVMTRGTNNELVNQYFES